MPAPTLSRLVVYGCIALPFSLAFIWQILFAFGLHPGQKRYNLSLAFVTQLFEQPAIWRSLALSLITGLAATMLALLLVAWLVSYTNPTKLARQLRPWMALILSTPYLAFVVGWQFVISPSGLISRVVALFSNQDLPPSITTSPDAFFIGYVIMLAIKESGFLLMLLLAQLSNMAFDRYYQSGLALGYSTPTIWRKILLPMLYPRLRLGIWILLVYSTTNVEVALFAAPNLPELFSLRIMQWFTKSELDFQLIASAASLLFLLSLIGLLGLWVLGEKLLAKLLRPWCINNRRGKWQPTNRSFAFAKWYMLSLYGLPLVVLVIWSISSAWTFPNLIPSGFSLHWWFSFNIAKELLHSLLIAVTTGFVALLLALLYVESTKGKTPKNHLWLLYLPLLTPQLALSLGLAINANIAHSNGTWLAVLVGHLLFMLPYMVLVLSPVWAGYDNRYSQVSSLLGHNYWRTWWRVKLPLCMRPVLFSLALGISVSVNLYLPTILLGEGQVTTLMTEMVGAGVSYDRRQLGVFSLWLLLIPLIAFACASIYPTLRYGNIRPQH